MSWRRCNPLERKHMELSFPDLPSWELTYPAPAGTFEDDKFPFPKVWYFSSQEGTFTVCGVSILGDVLKFPSFICKLLEQATMPAIHLISFFHIHVLNIHKNICWIWRNLRFTKTRVTDFVCFCLRSGETVCKVSINIIQLFRDVFSVEKCLPSVIQLVETNPVEFFMLIEIGNQKFPHRFGKKKHPP